ncbi:hypothetical protein [Nocardia sp. NPDC005366]|uniref:hypothetical protein n=1 Tax=Nocardia sp. NPDC005366 TaxID=3156878 RepID=UPI0033B7873F
MLDFDARIPRTGSIFRFTASDPRDLRAVAVAIGRGDPAYGALGAFIGDQLVGVANFIAGKTTTTAEVALIIAHDNTVVVGAELLRQLTDLARARGVQRFVADVIPTNSMMMRLFIDAGYPVLAHRRDDIARVGVQL